MRTKVGQEIVKRNSKKMDDLNTRLIEMASEIENLRAMDWDGSYLKSLLKSIKANKRQHTKLQEEINLMCLIESYLKFK